MLNLILASVLTATVKHPNNVYLQQIENSRPGLGRWKVVKVLDSKVSGPESGFPELP